MQSATHTQDTPAIDRRLAQFSDALLERSYTNDRFAETRSRFTILASICLVPLLGFRLSDITLPIMLAASLVCIYQVRRAKNSNQASPYLLAWLALSTLGIAYINIASPAEYLHPPLLNGLAILACYLAYPNRLLWQTTGAAVVSTSSIAVTLLLKADISVGPPWSIVVGIFLTNVLGYVSSRRFHRTDRARFWIGLQQQHMQIELRRMANEDSLTGIATRRHLVEVGNAEVRRAHRYATPLSVMVFDLDNFKRINNRHGHNAGDEALRVFSQTVRRMAREQDSLGRMGGEEFALIMPETSLDGARVLASQIGTACRELEVQSEDTTFGFTVSIGVSSVDTTDKTIIDSLERADIALYQAKVSGRDRLQVA